MAKKKEKKVEAEVKEEVKVEATASTEAEAGIVPGLQDVDISDQVQSAFLDYAMSVIVARAIPDVRDGMKPVHRRIIYSMFESGTTPDKPHKKCARIVGDVMGKYHPHGDAAIYGAVVRLAQPFAMRNILVDGHGNFGSIDGDEPAAYRYTEARLAKLALQMVRDIDCDVVDFMDNYDGVDQEPTVLPSRFPNLLVNGSSGIAVGMATNIPTHNLGEAIDATIAIAKNPELTTLDIMGIMPGPDFPTGGTILGRQGIKDAYDTGSGSIVIRSKCHVEESESTGRKRIIVEEIPYGVNKARLIESIAELVKDKVIDGITNIRDESNKEGIRVVIDVRHDCIPEVILNHLYKLTQLQTTFGIIFLCLENGAPKILPITAILKDYLEHQIEVVARRTKFLLKKDEDRRHIVLGLLKAVDNIDEVVHIIRHSATPEEAITSLMNKFDFSEPQTQAILAMTLRRLTGLEKTKLDEEKAELEQRIKDYQHILESRGNEIEVVIKELEEVKQRFADDRRTEISDSLGDIDDESLIPQQDIVVVITQNGYVKRMTTDTFRTQNRGGRGVRGVTVGDTDLIRLLLHTKTHTNLLFFSNKGKVYRIRGYKVPEGGRISKGIPVQNLLNLEKEERIMSIIDLGDNTEPQGFLTFFTRNGLVKRTPIAEYISIRQNGKIAIGLREGDQLLDVKQTNGECMLGMSNAKGKMVNFPETTVRPMGRTATGVKGMNATGTTVVSASTSLEGHIVLAITQNGYGKMTESSEYRQTNRGTKGVLTLNTTQKNGRLIATKQVNGDEDLMIITTGGIVIRVPIAQIKLSGRNTQGVRVIRLEEGHKVVGVTVIPHDVGGGEVDPNAGELPAEGVSEEEIKAAVAEAKAAEPQEEEEKEEKVVSPDEVA
ncbi:MAG: DNA gyrase subunit A [Bacilli bacterium]|nr:DNA gyrase subunit A [Bacilli bacterium]